MPNDGTSIEIEPVAIFTGCLCEKGRFGVHDATCPTQTVKLTRPNPRAGKRSWRTYTRRRNYGGSV
jgi:hypothetical protein